MKKSNTKKVATHIPKAKTSNITEDLSKPQTPTSVGSTPKSVNLDVQSPSSQKYGDLSPRSPISLTLDGAGLHSPAITPKSMTLSPVLNTPKSKSLLPLRTRSLTPIDKSSKKLLFDDEITKSYEKSVQKIESEAGEGQGQLHLGNV